MSPGRYLSFVFGAVGCRGAGKTGMPQHSGIPVFYGFFLGSGSRSSKAWSAPTVGSAQE